MGDSALPPSRFGAGFTVGGPTVAPSAARPTVIPPGVSVVKTNPLAVLAFVLVLLFGPFVVPLTIPLAFVARSRSAQAGQ
ncbi:MAG: hypothetical protein ACRDU5_15950, partial [Mycobacterium sp.]